MTTSETNIAGVVEQAVVPLLEVHGFELVVADYVPRSRILRLYIDNEAGVTIDDCTRVSHLVSDLLDGEGYSDLLGQRYTLEVSSPGLDRPLVKPTHFQRFVGHPVSVKTARLQAGRRNFGGMLAAADDTGIKVIVDGQEHVIAYEVIQRARLVPDL